MNAHPQSDLPNKHHLAEAIVAADILLGKTYLVRLGEIEALPRPPAEPANRKPDFAKELNKHVRLFEITRLVLDRHENMRDKLATVFQAVHAASASLLSLVIGRKDSVSIYLGVRSEGTTDHLQLAQDVLEGGMTGNFPGVVFRKPDLSELGELVQTTFQGAQRVVSVTDVPGRRTKEETRDRKFMQGIEKLIDAMRGKEYTFLVIADPVSAGDLATSRRALENLYSNLVPFGQSQFTAGLNAAESINESCSVSVTETVNRSITETVTHTMGRSHTVTDGKNSGKNFNLGGIGALVGFAAGSFFGPPGMYIGAGLGGALGGSFGFNWGKSHSVADGVNESDGKSRGITIGEAEGKQEGHSFGAARTAGRSASLQIPFENHTVKQLLGRIDKTLARYDTCGDLGMWNCAAYFLSGKPDVAQMAASVYHALVRGEDSSLETGGVTMWDGEKSKVFMEYLKRMEHPRLLENGLLTAGTLVSSAELAIGAGLPNRPVPGVAVLECAEFGRTVSRHGDEGAGASVRLGTVFHMHREEKLPVELDVDNLASHVFVTGSTGCGKSNTVFAMLSRLAAMKNGVTFLAVEPAKGEYRRVFGGRAAVYGTNPALGPLLRINPFSFPHGNPDPGHNIHILEHLDRLVEIFNVCWPMYAAMPAVLKDAIEKSYEDCGWNLAESTNRFEGEGWKNLYPGFADVARNIRRIIDASEYDAENKGAYKGSLLTRIRSLANGINGLLFTDDEIPAKELFDRNAIADLSRVGSSETKSLIMGLLVLKLQEYRMAGGGTNGPLRHVTVLEEAHHLLKRSSVVSSPDSSNLLGKSVEMLANSIAEMRTYGEGFIIADQAPALLDMSVIRNTNTKIAMRLPDQGDRELVGKAMHLNDRQVAELAKLPRGVAAVYQNEWVESVLCKVDLAPPEPTGAGVAVSKGEWTELSLSERVVLSRLMLEWQRLPKKFLADLKAGRRKISARSRVLIAQRLADGGKRPWIDLAGSVITELFPGPADVLRQAIDASPGKTGCAEWMSKLGAAVEDIGYEIRSDEPLCALLQWSIVREVLVHELKRDDDYGELCRVARVREPQGDVQ